MKKYVTAFASTFVGAIIIIASTIFVIGGPFDAYKTPAQLAGKQIAHPDLVALPSDLRYNGPFKLSHIDNDKPEITWISSSRAGAMRSEMLAPYRFYNLSFTAWTLDQIAEEFERTTRNNPPRVVIIELDYFLFSDGWNDGYDQTRRMIYDRPLHYATTSLINFVKDAPHDLSQLEELKRSSSGFIGPQAILSRSGFRSDGSYQYPPGFVEKAQQTYQTVAYMMEATPGGLHIPERLKKPILRLAQLAKERHVKLLAVQLPFIRSCIDFLDNDISYKTFSGNWREFEDPAMGHWLKSLDIDFFDLSRSEIDDDPLNFSDAYHPSERGMEQVMSQLMEDPVFSSYFPEVRRYRR